MVRETAENSELVSFLLCTFLSSVTRSASVMALGTTTLCGFAVLFFFFRFDVSDLLDVCFLDAKSEPPFRDSLSLVQRLRS